jgi:hypothetical protein
MKIRFKIVSAIFVLYAAVVIAFNLLISAAVHIVAEQNTEIGQKTNQKKILYAAKYMHNNNRIAKDKLDFIPFFLLENHPPVLAKITSHRTIARSAFAKTANLPIQHRCLRI